MKRSLLVALTSQRVIGREGALPWHLSADLQRFKQLTMGHAIIMGRKTFTSIGRILPGRHSVVVTHQPDFQVNDARVTVVHSVEEAFRVTEQNAEAFVIGGGEIYRQALPLVQRVHATWVDTEVEGDTFFPEFPTNDWRLVSNESIPADAKNDYATRYCVYERV